MTNHAKQFPDEMMSLVSETTASILPSTAFIRPPRRTLSCRSLQNGESVHKTTALLEPSIGAGEHDDQHEMRGRIRVKPMIVSDDEGNFDIDDGELSNMVMSETITIASTLCSGPQSMSQAEGTSTHTVSSSKAPVPPQYSDDDDDESMNSGETVTSTSSGDGRDVIRSTAATFCVADTIIEDHTISQFLRDEGVNASGNVFQNPSSNESGEEDSVVSISRSFSTSNRDEEEDFDEESKTDVSEGVLEVSNKDIVNPNQDDECGDGADQGWFCIADDASMDSMQSMSLLSRMCRGVQQWFSCCLPIDTE